MKGTDLRMSVVIYTTYWYACVSTTLGTICPQPSCHSPLKGLDLRTKANDMEIHLNNCKKSTKESSGKTGCMLNVAVTPHDRTQYNADSSTSK